MGRFPEYDKYDALGLAELVKQKEVSPKELLEEAINRIESLNPDLNAVIYKMFDIAKSVVKGPLPDGPFTGVPFLTKDLHASYAGVPMTSGSRAYRDFIPEHDSEMVRRFKKSGVVILGKTNTPEFGLLGITEPELHGPTRNPWNPGHTPGGSSGGSGAAVAAGMVPFASGGDGGGSIRIPSSCCGIFGLKPSRGRNPTGPEHGSIWQGAVVEHVLTRSVRDSAAMLDATSGPDTGAPYIITEPKSPYVDEIEKEPGSLRIAFNTASPVDKEVDMECVEAVHNSAKLLESLGHNVEEAKPNIDGLALAVSYFTMYFGEMAADIQVIKETMGSSESKAGVETLTRTLGMLGRTISAGDFVYALREWDKASRAMGRFFQNYNLYLTPTIACTPPEIGELGLKPAEKNMLKIMNSFGLGKLLKLTGVIDKIAIDGLAHMPFTQLANLTGLPAMSVPLHWSKAGLPVGVQFIAPFGDESTLFKLASQLEKAKPWFDKRPEMIYSQ